MDQGNIQDGIARATLVGEDVEPHVENRDAKQQAGTCVRKRCSADAEDGSDYCKRHGDAQRTYNAQYMARRRAEWAAKKKCTRCGGRRKKGSKWCPACLIECGKVPRVGVESHVENRAQRIAARIVSVVDTTDGYARTRLAGGKRGAPSAEQADDADLRDLRLFVEKAAAGLAVANSEEVRALPRIQRDEAKFAAMSWVALLVRSGLAFMKRKGVPLPSQANHIIEGEMGGTDGKTGR